MPFPANLLVGTSSWSSSDWLGSFYPANLKPGQFIEAYARKFPAVEIDSTYYSIPPPHVVASWREKTPPGFIFAAKVPGVITHEKVLKDCQAEFTSFLNNISLLGDRLGPLLLQFPYFNRNAFPSREPFDNLLKPFLAESAQGIQVRLGNSQQELAQLGLSRNAARAPGGIRPGGASVDAAHRHLGQSARPGHQRLRLRALHRRPQSASKPKPNAGTN